MADLGFGERELAYLKEALASGELWRLSGTFVNRLEEAFAAWLGRQYVLGVCTGTSANECALAGLGLQPGDEVICPAAVPIFVSLPVVAVGAVPVFAECDPRTLILSPEGLEAAITPRTKAVMVVHLLGQPAPMDDLLAVARKHELKVVEDCAQAYDALEHGRKTGTMGDVACFSLQASKHITCGEGGLVATDDPEIYARAVTFSNSGMAWYGFGLERPVAEKVAGMPTRGHFSFGHDFRMGELPAAVALAQLERIDEFNAQRRKLVAIIERELDGVPGVELAHVYPETVPNYWIYPLRVPDGLGAYPEINYLEVVFQQMQRDRRTSLGVPLPDYVQYVPGACPVTEAATRRWRQISVHHRQDPEAVRAAAVKIRDDVLTAVR